MAGARVLKMREVAVERFGEASFERALARLPSDVREQYRGLTSVSWAPTSLDYAVHDALAAEVGLEPVALHEELLREAMSRSFKTLWRLFLSFTSDEALIRRAPAIYARTRNVGDVSIDVVGDRRATVRIAKYPKMTARDARCIGVGLEVVLTLTGRRSARVVESLGVDSATYDLSWT